MRMLLGILVVFTVAVTALVLMIVFATPVLGFGFLSEVVIVGVAFAVAAGAASVVLPRE